MNLATEANRTIKTNILRGVLEIKIDRPEADNSINDLLLTELLQTVRSVEHDNEVKVIVLTGNENHFCTGMDFQAVSSQHGDAIFQDDPNKYYELLKLFASSAKIIISKVEGKVNAGGIGLIAASDIVLSGSRAVFSLSEALFGLVPACVMPFLIRRLGHHKAQWMAMTTQTISAERAFELGLVDEYSDNVNDLLRRNLLRLNRLHPETTKTLKNYMGKLWIIDETTQQVAVDQIATLMQSEKVLSNIKNFVDKGIFPWDK
ncbi:MAG: enoyl-CoA hydratase/isomerase [Bacteroidota bacterium]